jgi:meiotic recombination protein SPO11
MRYCETVALLRLLTLSHEALVTGKVITKRNIYYRHTELYRRQDVVDHLVDSLSATLGCGRGALNIVADSRALISGAVRLVMVDGSVLTCSEGDENVCDDVFERSWHETLILYQGIPVPPLGKLREIALSSPQWLLIVEKEVQQTNTYSNSTINATLTEPRQHFERSRHLNSRHIATQVAGY